MHSAMDCLTHGMEVVYSRTSLTPWLLWWFQMEPTIWISRALTEMTPRRSHSWERRKPASSWAGSRSIIRKFIFDTPLQDNDEEKIFFYWIKGEWNTINSHQMNTSILRVHKKILSEAHGLNEHNTPAACLLSCSLLLFNCWIERRRDKVTACTHKWIHRTISYE